MRDYLYCPAVAWALVERVYRENGKKGKGATSSEDMGELRGRLGMPRSKKVFL